MDFFSVDAGPVLCRSWEHLRDNVILVYEN